MNANEKTAEAGPSSTLDIDILREAGDWPAAAEEPLRRGLAEAWRMAGQSKGEAELCVVLADDAFVRRLNKTYRGKDKPTNVLSFPLADIPVAAGGEPLWSEPLTPLGDIVLARETIAREAEEQGKSFEDHLAHLSIHGLLHLLGEDHEVDEDAERMENLEREILARLGIADPYLEMAPKKDLPKNNE